VTDRLTETGKTGVQRGRRAKEASRNADADGMTEYERRARVCVCVCVCVYVRAHGCMCQITQSIIKYNITGEAN